MLDALLQGIGHVVKGSRYRRQLRLPLRRYPRRELSLAQRASGPGQDGERAENVTRDDEGEEQEECEPEDADQKLQEQIVAQIVLNRLAREHDFGHSKVGSA